MKPQEEPRTLLPPLTTQPYSPTMFYRHGCINHSTVINQQECHPRLPALHNVKQGVFSLLLQPKHQVVEPPQGTAFLLRSRVTALTSCFYPEFSAWLLGNCRILSVSLLSCEIFLCQLESIQLVVNVATFEHLLMWQVLRSDQGNAFPIFHFPAIFTPPMLKTLCFKPINPKLRKANLYYSVRSNTSCTKQPHVMSHREVMILPITPLHHHLKKYFFEVQSMTFHTCIHISTATTVTSVSSNTSALFLVSSHS